MQGMGERTDRVRKSPFLQLNYVVSELPVYTVEALFWRIQVSQFVFFRPSILFCSFSFPPEKIPVRHVVLSLSLPHTPVARIPSCTCFSACGVYPFRLRWQNGDNRFPEYPSPVSLFSFPPSLDPRCGRT